MSEEVESNVVSFEELGLSEALVRALTDTGYEAATPIQARTIPILLQGRDIIGQAQTGTGKTAAFALPILQQLTAGLTTTQALILTPTRELAIQVAEAIHTYSKHMGGVTVLPVYGGAPITMQLRRLERGVQIVVGTPGRIIDHLERGSLNLQTLRFLVLDEADEMLRMGFIDDVRMIMSKMPESRQTALFSATMPEPIREIANKHLRNPEQISIERKNISAPDIDQRYLNISENQKLRAVTAILEVEDAGGVIIFRRTKTGTAELAERLQARGFAAEPLNGDMTQGQRESVVRRLRSGQLEIVVATDVAARGLDVEQITHVINYDVPYDAEAYVHRIGRTGRAGRKGVAVLFVTARERRMLREIERFIGKQLLPMQMPTEADLAAKRIAALRAQIVEALASTDLDMYIEMVEEIAESEGRDLAEVAAATAKVMGSNRPTVNAPEAEEERRPARESREESRGFRDDRPPREDRKPLADRARAFTGERSFDEKPREARPRDDKRSVRFEASERPARPTREEEGPKVNLVVSLGREHGVRPGDIVGSIANEADIPGRLIGPIDIGDDETIVGIPERFKEKVISAMRGTMYKGNKVTVREHGGELLRRGPREDRPPRERKSGNDGPFWVSLGGEKRRERSFEQERAPRREDRDERPPRRDDREERPFAKKRFEARDERPARTREPLDSGRPRTRSDRPTAGAGRPSFGGRDSAARPSSFKRDGAASAGYKKSGGFSRDAGPSRGPSKGGFSRDAGPSRGPAKGGFKRDGAKGGFKKSGPPKGGKRK